MCVLLFKEFVGEIHRLVTLLWFSKATELIILKSPLFAWAAPEHRQGPIRQVKGLLFSYLKNTYVRKLFTVQD